MAIRQLFSIGGVCCVARVGFDPIPPFRSLRRNTRSDTLATYDQTRAEDHDQLLNSKTKVSAQPCGQKGVSREF